MKEKKKAKGVKIAFVFIPTIIIISISYTLIIISTFLINYYSVENSDALNRTSLILSYVNGLQGYSSKQSETATTFIYNPVLPNGQYNMGPISEYMEGKTDETKNPKNIMVWLKELNISNEDINTFQEVIDCIDNMEEDQAHSFYLLNQVSYIDLESIGLFDVIIEYQLSESELSITDDDYLKSQAFRLVQSKEYSEYKSFISDTTRKLSAKYTNDAKELQQKNTNSLKLYRGLLWGSIALILLANVIFFFILTKKLVLPILRYAKKIDLNEELPEEHALYEANYLAINYNKLLERHKEFEKELRNVAEIDSLTGLPNRYCYNEFLKNVEPKEISTCVLLLDINNLKTVNDTYGHSKGDELIKKASNIIKETFLNNEGKNCYRIGGDEFVCILDNILESDIENYIKIFEEKQQENDISIALGYAYSDNVSLIGYEKLIMLADMRMYVNKKETKKIDSRPVN